MGIQFKFQVRGVGLGVALVLAVMMASTPHARAETYVTTYVTKVQEKRKTLRWTLTEWLKIKERMRMMDVWLAMFSQPKQEEFSPELNLSYGLTRGTISLTESNSIANVEDAALNGSQARAQFWLTNLISASTGVRTLNVDLGVEGFTRQSGTFETDVPSTVAQTSTQTAVDSSIDGGRQLSLVGYGANFRVFGKNIQDSYLVFKYGNYEMENTIPSWSEGGVDIRGSYAGGEMSLYLLHHLGVEGNYLSFGDQASPRGKDALKGSYYDYLAFVEISVLRLMFGQYQEDWRLTSTSSDEVLEPSVSESREKGFLGGAKLLF